MGADHDAGRVAARLAGTVKSRLGAADRSLPQTLEDDQRLADVDVASAEGAWLSAGRRARRSSVVMLPVT